MQLETEKLQHLTTLTPAGAVAGVIDRGDIVRAVAKKLKLAISESEIKRIKEEGRYPLALPLQSIAQATADAIASESQSG